MREIILASTSPRRRDLMDRLGVPYRTIPPRFEETPTSLPPETEALSFAEQKALSVQEECPGALVIGSDTLIDCGGEKLGKPSDPADAERILTKLSGKTHRVLTAVVLLDTKDGSLKRHCEIAFVTFKPLAPEKIRDYVATGEPMGKAGAYAVQGKARTMLIEKVEGDEEAIIGLPVRILKKWLTETSR